METLNAQLRNIFTAGKATLVIGDFNFCYKETSTTINRFFATGNFKQLINEPTHIDGHMINRPGISSRWKKTTPIHSSS